MGSPEVLEVARRIETAIERLEKNINKLPETASRRANALANYDKELALTIARIRQGDSFDLHGIEVINPPATLIEKIAKGALYNERLELEIADSGYRSLCTAISVIQAELNGLQSIYKRLEYM